MDCVTAHLSIGDFSRATHMTVKMLRHYHQIGLLEPADVDRHNGYRRYNAEQIPTAQVIRRLRDLDMPLEEIQGGAGRARHPDPQRADHLTSQPPGRRPRATAARGRLAARPAGTRPADAPAGIEVRSVPAVPAAAVTEVVDAEDSGSWLQGALGELQATLAAQRLPAGGHAAASSPTICLPTIAAGRPSSFPARDPSGR